MSVNCKTKEIGKAPMRLDRTCKWESGRGKPTGGHYTPRLSFSELRLISNMHNKPEPDTTASQTDRGASPLGGVAQWGANAKA